MIDPTAEAEAIADWKAGDILAGDRLLRMHAGLIYSIALRYVTDRCELDDLLQVGRLALLDAAAEHDASRGRLSTFATRKIRGRSRWLMLSEQRITEPNAHAMSFDAPLGDWGGTLHEVIAAPAPDELPDRDAGSLLDTLPAHERDVIERHYAEPSQTLVEIAAARGVSKQAAHTMKNRAIARLRLAASMDPRAVHDGVFRYSGDEATAVEHLKKNAAGAAKREARGAAALRCSLCGEERHNRRTCPLRQAA